MRGQVFALDTELGGFAKAEEVNRHIPVVGVVEQCVGSSHIVGRATVSSLREVAFVGTSLIEVLEHVVELVLRIACIEIADDVAIACSPLVVSLVDVVATIPSLGLQTISAYVHEANLLPYVDALTVVVVAIPLLDYARVTSVVLESAVAVDGPTLEA